ncbi:MAG: hypothetical protein FJ134_14600 [Deltaproteobacteria bacterium]|nr:hypothetical protein [Deltaproteobacteria bacterium]
MNKFIFLFKRISDLIIKISLIIFRAIFFIIPIWIIFTIALQFYVLSIENSVTTKQYNIIFAAIGITATLSGLSFRAAASSEENYKRRYYYHQGQRLLHATLLFIMTMPLSYIYNEFGLINKLTIISFIRSNLNFDVSNSVKTICFIFYNFFFYFGLLLTAIGIECLNEILWKEKLLD